MSIIAAFIIALIVAILFSPYKRSDSLKPLTILFLVLFFAGLSAQFWIVPFGPKLWGVAWMRIVFIVFVFALLFSAPPVHRGSASYGDGAGTTAGGIFGAFIWILLFLLILSIAFGLFYSNDFLVE